MQKEWRIKEYNEDIVKQLAEYLKIDSITAILLNVRGISNKEEGRKFIVPDIICDLYNPFLMRDMEKAVSRVRKAIDEHEHICIYGDRDVDGISGAAMLYKVFKQCEARVDVFIPNGDEGYGLTEKVVDSFHQSGCRLIITVDNGITSYDAVEKANKYNIDVIITDHHTPEERLPNAFAIINPRCENDYPFKGLAGVGVAYKFIHSLFFSYTSYYNKEIVVLDIETTGFDPDKDDIIEIGAVKLRNFVTIGEFHEFLKPSGPLSHKDSQSAGIDDQASSSSKSTSSYISEFYEFIKEAILAGHNINKFKLGFIKRYIKKYLNINIENKIIDTMALAREHLKLEKIQLSDVASFLQINIPEKCQGAYDNALTAAEILKKFYKVTRKIRKILEKFSEYAVLGTLADVVPLTDENRLIVKLGLKKLKNTDIIGLDILFKKLKIIKKTLIAKTVAWNMIPILNAPGRMGMADKALALFLTEDNDKAEKIADEIIQINEERKAKQGIIFNKIMDVLKEKVDIENDKIFIIDIEDTEHGVTGVIANKIKELYFRPVVILIINKDIGIGSARSIEHFRIYEAFKKCEDLFLNFGGHKYAVGFTIESSRIAEFKDRLKKIVNESLSTRDLVPVLDIDAVLEGNMLDIKLIRNIEQLFSPYGESNAEPLFLIKNLKLNNLIPIGLDKRHLKLNVLTANNQKFDALWWGGTQKDFNFMIGREYDMVFKLEVNTWKNVESVSLIIEDMQLS